MIFKTRARQLSVDVYLTGPQLECAVYEIQRLACERRREERTEVMGTVAFYASRDDNFWERFVCKFQMRVRLIVLQQHIETRLVLLYQVRFQYKSFDLVVDDDEF